MTHLREALAETRALLRRLLEEQTIADRELNSQRIALGLPKKPFVSDELRDAVAKLDAADAKAEERMQTRTRSEEGHAARASETEGTSDSHAERAEQQRPMSSGQDE